MSNVQLTYFIGIHGFKLQRRSSQSDLEAEVPHALLVRLDEVGTVRLAFLHYAEEDVHMFTPWNIDMG